MESGKGVIKQVFYVRPEMFKVAPCTRRQVGDGVSCCSRQFQDRHHYGATSERNVTDHFQNHRQDDGLKFHVRKLLWLLVGVLPARNCPRIRWAYSLDLDEPAILNQAPNISNDNRMAGGCNV